MYKIVIIDDKIEEVCDTLDALYTNHVMYYYSTGEKLPSHNERILFQDVQYICLDFHLENLMASLAVGGQFRESMLAHITSKFPINERTTIVINTAYAYEFKKEKYLEYLGGLGISINENNIITYDKKDKISTGQKFSILHEDEILDSMRKDAIHSFFRNLVITEAIEVENLVADKVREKLATCTIPPNKIDCFIKWMKQSPGFSQKIGIYDTLFNNPSLVTMLDELKDRRNKYAHEVGFYDNSKIEDFVDKIKSIREELEE